MNWLLADKFMIEIDSWSRGVALLASHIEDLQRKFEMRVLNRYEKIRSGQRRVLCSDEKVTVALLFS
jgi:hypothetical protein